MITAMPKKGTETTASSYLKKKENDQEWFDAKKALQNEPDRSNVSKDDQPVETETHFPDYEKKAVPGTAYDQIKTAEQNLQKKKNEERDAFWKEDDEFYGWSRK